MSLNITISKGALTVTVYPQETAEEISNKLTILPIPQTAANQATGTKDTKILDLLRLTHTLIVRGYITASNSYTAKEVKAQLISIIEGASINGGVCTLVYDGDSFEGYIEKFIITEKSQDDPVGAGYTGTDHARYELNLTFIEGVAV